MVLEDSSSHSEGEEGGDAGPVNVIGLDGLVAVDGGVVVGPNPGDPVKPDIEEVARRRLKLNYLGLWNFMYDVFTVTIAVTDIITDILITIHWFKEKQMTFFWISITIFITAQLSYTGVFVAMFARTDNRNYEFSVRRFMAYVIVLLPFGQLLPLVVWIHGFQFKWAQRVFRALGLDQMENEINRRDDGDKDPLAAYIIQKVMSHAGFFIEAMVESVPQSILQMIYMVITRDINPVSVFSITVSITSLASKGVVLSYSIDRPTFIFNLTCIVYDVFSVFSTVAWLFAVTAYDDTYHIFYIRREISLLSTIWFYKEFLVVLLPIVGFIIFFSLGSIHEIFFSSRRPMEVLWDILRDLCRCEAICLGLIMIVGMSLASIPLIVFMEAVKFSLIPVVVFNSIDSAHSRHPLFFSALFGFIKGGPDYAERMRVVNQACAIYAAASSDFTSPLEEPSSRWQYQNYQYQALRRYCLTCPKGEFQFSKFRFHNQQSLDSLRWYMALPSGSTQMDFVEEKVSINFNQIFDVCLALYFILVVVPVLSFSTVYSMLFPYLSFFTRDALGGEVPLLHRALFGIQVALICVGIFLGRRAYQFAHIQAHLLDLSGPSNYYQNDFVVKVMDLYVANIKNEEELWQVAGEIFNLKPYSNLYGGQVPYHLIKSNKTNIVAYTADGKVDHYAYLTFGGIFLDKDGSRFTLAVRNHLTSCPTLTDPLVKVKMLKKETTPQQALYRYYVKIGNKDGAEMYAAHANMAPRVSRYRFKPSLSHLVARHTADIDEHGVVLGLWMMFGEVEDGDSSRPFPSVPEFMRRAREMADQTEAFTRQAFAAMADQTMVALAGDKDSGNGKGKAPAQADSSDEEDGLVVRGNRGGRRASQVNPRAAGPAQPPPPPPPPLQPPMPPPPPFMPPPVRRQNLVEPDGDDMDLDPKIRAVLENIKHQPAFIKELVKGVFTSFWLGTASPDTVVSTEDAALTQVGQVLARSSGARHIPRQAGEAIDLIGAIPRVEERLRLFQLEVMTGRGLAKRTAAWKEWWCSQSAATSPTSVVPHYPRNLFPYFCYAVWNGKVVWSNSDFDRIGVSLLQVTAHSVTRNITNQSEPTSYIPIYIYKARDKRIRLCKRSVSPFFGRDSEDEAWGAAVLQEQEELVTQTAQERVGREGNPKLIAGVKNKIKREPKKKKEPKVKRQATRGADHQPNAGEVLPPEDGGLSKLFSESHHFGNSSDGERDGDKNAGGSGGGGGAGAGSNGGIGGGIGGSEGGLGGGTGGSGGLEGSGGVGMKPQEELPRLIEEGLMAASEPSGSMVAPPLSEPAVLLDPSPVIEMERGDAAAAAAAAAASTTTAATAAAAASTTTAATATATFGQSPVSTPNASARDLSVVDIDEPQVWGEPLVPNQD